MGRTGWLCLAAAALAVGATTWFLFRPRYAYVWQHEAELSEQVNTANDEVYEPNVAPDGKTLIFTRGGAGKGANLYRVAFGPDGAYGDAEPVRDINTEFDEIDGMPGADGGLYFYSDRPGGLGGYDLYASQLNEDGSYASAENLGANVNSPFNDYDPCLSPDGKLLYFSSNRHSGGSEDDYDILVSLKSDEGWSTPRALSGVNTERNEWEPMLSADGRTLYFTSNRPRDGSNGVVRADFDLYAATFVRSEGWGNVVNLGDGINTEHDELDPALCLKSRQLLFVQGVRGGDSYAVRIWKAAPRAVPLGPILRLERIPRAAVLVLLSLALSLLLLWLLVHGWARLSTLQKCLVASLLIHGIAAWLFTMTTLKSDFEELRRSDTAFSVYTDLPEDIEQDAFMAALFKDERNIEVSSAPQLAPLALDQPSIPPAEVVPPTQSVPAVEPVEIERQAAIEIELAALSADVQPQAVDLPVAESSPEQPPAPDVQRPSVDAVADVALDTPSMAAASPGAAVAASVERTAIATQAAMEPVQFAAEATPEASRAVERRASVASPSSSPSSRPSVDAVADVTLDTPSSAAASPSAAVAASVERTAIAAQAAMEPVQFAAEATPEASRAVERRASVAAPSSSPSSRPSVDAVADVTLDTPSSAAASPSAAVAASVERTAIAAQAAMEPVQFAAEATPEASRAVERRASVASPSSSPSSRPSVEAVADVALDTPSSAVASPSAAVAASVERTAIAAQAAMEPVQFAAEATPEASRAVERRASVASPSSSPSSRPSVEAVADVALDTPSMAAASPSAAVAASVERTAIAAQAAMEPVQFAAEATPEASRAVERRASVASPSSSPSSRPSVDAVADVALDTPSSAVASPSAAVAASVERTAIAAQAAMEPVQFAAEATPEASRAVERRASVASPSSSPSSRPSVEAVADVALDTPSMAAASPSAAVAASVERTAIAAQAAMEPVQFAAEATPEASRAVERRASVASPSSSPSSRPSVDAVADVALDTPSMVAALPGTAVAASVERTAIAAQAAMEPVQFAAEATPESSRAVERRASVASPSSSPSSRPSVEAVADVALDTPSMAAASPGAAVAASVQRTVSRTHAAPLAKLNVPDPDTGAVATASIDRSSVRTPPSGLRPSAAPPPRPESRAAPDAVLYRPPALRVSPVIQAGTSRRVAASERVARIEWGRPDNLGSRINIGGENYEPNVLADGKTLLFTRGSAGRGASIFVSEWRNGDWSEPVPFAEVNSEYDDIDATLSGDGRTLVFYSNRPGGYGGPYDLYISVREDEQWTPPANMGPVVNSMWNDYDPHLSGDGSRLFFSSNRHSLGSEGDYDLYVMERGEDGNWEPPQPVSINTSFNEWEPALSPDGLSLYFASNRPGGKGGYDIWVSHWRNGQWSAPEPLDGSVNSERDELDPSVSPDGETLYFVSNRAGSVGSFDVWKSKRRLVE